MSTAYSSWLCGMAASETTNNGGYMKRTTAASAVLFLASCATLGVRQADLDAWVDVPVEALDTHTIFLSIPMFRTSTASGIEIRNYANGKDVASCYSNAGIVASGAYVSTARASAFTSCSSGRVVCNNIFYIRDGRVLEYAPTGNCYTDDRVRPQRRAWQ